VSSESSVDAESFLVGARRGLLQKHRWLTFVLPFAVFMAVGALEPKPDVSAEPDSPVAAAADGDAGASSSWIPYRCYPAVYTLKIVLTVAAILFVLPGYREFPLRLSPWSVAVGVVGVVVWVVICRLDLERTLLEPLGLGSFVSMGQRSAFDPFEQPWGNPAAAWVFLGVRLFGLAVVVAVIEEFFLRAFVMRFVMAANWWEIPFGQVSLLAVVVGTAIPMLSHPAELLAAAAWFSMVTVLMVKTRNIWDCVVAHGVTNFLLGVYVVLSGEWQLL
jgi:CAAX protease family protein